MEILTALLASALAFLIFTTQPEPHKEVAILLPEADGKSSGIVFKSHGQQAVVTESYQAVEMTGESIETKQYTAEEVQSLFPDLMQALPAKPRSFTLRFVKGSPILTPDSEAMMADIIEDVINRDSPEVTVTGHTDRAGTEDDNLALSLDRAMATRDSLVKGGIPEQVIQVAGRGESELEVETEDDVEEQLNRRVIVSVR